MAIQDQDVNRLKARMLAVGVTQLYVKRLAANDNSKQQVYLGMNFGVLNILPIGDLSPDIKNPKIIKSNLAFSWLTESGALSRAPGTQIILYPQYPEVRLSGFLDDCLDCPNELMRARQAGRYLFLGTTPTGQIIAFCASHSSSLGKELEALNLKRDTGVFSRITLESGYRDRDLLFSELLRISQLGWIDAKRLNKEGEIVRCLGTNCGGMTLEAELGIRPNSQSEPDFHGWEIKQHGVVRLNNLSSGGPITLMTPEPTGGIYANEGIDEFIRRFGYADKKILDRRNFGGIHLATKICLKTNLQLSLDGYDNAEQKLTDLSGGLSLVDQNGEAAAVWLYRDLLRHWTRKHARAAYVPSMVRKSALNQYCYGSKIRIAEGTDFLLFIKAVASGNVYYDPGIKIENVSSSSPKAKKRSQFRIKSSGIPLLYKSIEEIELNNY